MSLSSDQGRPPLPNPSFNGYSCKRLQVAKIGEGLVSDDRFLPDGAVTVEDSPEGAGSAAGKEAAEILKSAIGAKGRARVVFASAPSQEQMLHTLTSSEGIDWSQVESLHLDEYRGISPEHPASFGQWLQERLPAAAHAGLHRIRPDGKSSDEIARYSDLLRREEIDLVCLGIGVNGHIAFNEPGDTKFDDAALLREVPLTYASRKQQVDEGLFSALEEVPTHALSMTVSAILAGHALVCTVLGETKAPAVAAALKGPITTDVPSSALRTHARVLMFLDAGAASALAAD